MSLVRVYSDQYRWRRWSTVYPALGDLSNAQVLDLGCGIGAQARDLSRFGATVLGVDASREAIDHAASRGIPRARFVCDDITNLRDHAQEVDGVWTGFAAAYFPRFDVFLRVVEDALKPGGWMAITE